MKKLLVSTLAASSLLLAACSDNPEVASTEAGRIRQEDLYEAMKNEPLQSGLSVGETVLQRMLMADIFEHMYGDQVTEEDVDAEYEEAATQFGGVEQYEELLAMQGMDNEYIKENIRLTLLIRTAVEENLEITDEEIQEAYDAARPEITAQHILVEDEETAADIIAQLEDGADFAELVTEYSTDPGSLETEGTYSFNTGEMVPEFEEAAFALEEGETVSEPVQTDHGFHVIRRLELDYAPLEEQQDELRNTIIETTIAEDQAFMTEMVSRLAKEANVNISDDDLKGAMATYMEPAETPEEPVEEPAGPVEEPVEEDTDAEETEETEDTEGADDASEESDVE